MSTRWSKALVVCNAVAGCLLLLNVLSHIMQIQQGHVPGTEWGMTAARWKYIVIQQAAIGIGLLLLASLLWLKPYVARIADVVLAIPKLYYGFGFAIWARLSGNTLLLLASVTMLASVLLLPAMWVGSQKAKAKAAA